MSSDYKYLYHVLIGDVCLDLPVISMFTRQVLVHVFLCHFFLSNQLESMIKNSHENQYDSKINNLQKPQSESNLKNSFQTTKIAAPSTKKIITYKCKVCDYETSWTSRRPTTDIKIHMVRTHEVDELKTNWNRYFQLSKVERFVVLPYNQTLSLAEKKSDSTAVPRDSASKLITEKCNPFVFMSPLNSETLKQKNGQ